MDRIIDGKYHWNEESYSWERCDRFQTYKGVKITSITYHRDGEWNNHREYEVTWKDGKVSSFPINKRFSVKELKNYIDFKEKYMKAE